MRTIALFTFVAATTACSWFSSESAPKVEASASGLTGTPIGDPGTEERMPTMLQTGAYTVRIVSVMESPESRTDVYEGAEFPMDVQQVVGSSGYMLDGNMQIDGWNGRLRGRGVGEEVDPDYDCTSVVEVMMQGRSPESYRFQAVVREEVKVSGSECHLSNIGPAREETVAFRAQVVANQ